MTLLLQMQSLQISRSHCLQIQTNCAASRLLRKQSLGCEMCVCSAVILCDDASVSPVLMFLLKNKTKERNYRAFIWFPGGFDTFTVKCTFPCFVPVMLWLMLPPSLLLYFLIFVPGLGFSIWKAVTVGWECVCLWAINISMIIIVWKSAAAVL